MKKHIDGLRFFIGLALIGALWIVGWFERDIS